MDIGIRTHHKSRRAVTAAPPNQSRGSRDTGKDTTGVTVGQDRYKRAVAAMRAKRRQQQNGSALIK
jgi:hypothetical protein